MLTLYTNAFSPFARKVAMALGHARRRDPWRTPLIHRLLSSPIRPANGLAAWAAAWGLGFAAALPAGAQLFRPVGGEFQVNTYTTQRQDIPAVAAFPDGDPGAGTIALDALCSRRGAAARSRLRAARQSAGVRSDGA